jgi:hypothetical protein
MSSTTAADRFVTAEPNGMPSVSDVHESADGTGLEVGGWFATTHEDSDDEAFQQVVRESATTHPEHG